MALWEKDPEAYITECLWIVDKASGKEVPFKLNIHQQTVMNEVKRQLALGKPVRVQVLKCRQNGISTLCAAIMFWRNRFQGGRGMTVSLDNRSSEHIFTITQLFHERLPDNEKKILKPVNASKQELRFDRPHGGHLSIETAGKKSAGHSFTVRQLHFSERPRWPEGCEDSLIGLKNSIPPEPDTIIFDETVANGMSGMFYDDWNDPDSDFTKIFLSWKDHKKYTKPLPCDESQYEQQLTVEELKLIAKHSLSLEQIEWRRWSTRENCKKDPDIFKEQYPLTAAEAFRTTGKTFFNVDKLDSIQTESNPLTGDLELYANLGQNKEIEFKPDKQGNLTLFKRPQLRHNYVIGSDVAEGLEIEGAKEDGRIDPHDFSCADVIDRDTGEQVAHYHSKVTPDEFGRHLVVLGQWYNMAFQAVEANAGYGQHVITEMETQGYPRQLIYMDKRVGKLGWLTSKLTRTEMLASLDRSMRSGEVLINHRRTLNEMKGFVVKSSGKVEHGPGLHDDRVFSLAIANKMLELAPPVFDNIQPMSLNQIVDMKPLQATPYKQSFKSTATRRKALTHA